MNYEFHDEIRSVLDSIHSRDYKKIEFTGVYKEQLFGKTRCVMSFTPINDSVFWYKETYPGSRYGVTGDSSYYVRKYGWYFKSDMHGNIIIKNRPPYYLASIKDSSGYLILIEKTDTLDSHIQTENMHKEVYNSERKLVEGTSLGGSPILHFQRMKYQYIGDTTITRTVSGLIDNLSQIDSVKKVTSYTNKKRKVVIKEVVTGSGWPDENGTSCTVKKYNKDKKLVQIKFRYYHILFMIFPPGHLNIKYYKNTA